jgi:tRNA G10  N-methylase Trm11
MKYFFVLGRNPKLSRAEVFAYLENRKIKFDEIIFEGNLLVLNVGGNDGFEFNIQEFGGVMNLGKILFEGSDSGFEDYVAKEDLVPSDKFTFAVFGNFDDEILKRKFKSEKRKAMLKHGRKRMKFQGSGSVKGAGSEEFEGELPKAKFYFFIYEFKGVIYFGIVDQSYDYQGVSSRDMDKPHRRESLAISPRLSKILINLSGVVPGTKSKGGGRLLDCFCGVGGILQEAVLMGIDVHGVDRDREAIKWAWENFKWLEKEFDMVGKYDFEVGDSRDISFNKQFDGVAAESPLGEVVKKKLSNKDAAKMIEKFEGFIVPVLRNLKDIKKAGAKIAMTFPVVRDFRVASLDVANEAGLKVVGEAIIEKRSDQFVGRDFVVFE